MNNTKKSAEDLRRVLELRRSSAAGAKPGKRKQDEAAKDMADESVGKRK